MLIHARVIGLALLGAAILVRFAGRALGRSAFLLGGFATLYLASREWQTSASTTSAGAIVVVGVVASALLAWIIRATSFVACLGLLVGAWYLLLYGWIGADFVTTTAGSMAWVVAIVTSLMATDVASRWHVRRLGSAAAVAVSAVSGHPLP